MAYCTDCGSSIKEGVLHCPSCGARQPVKSAVMPRLDLSGEQNACQYRRMESFPPLFENEQPKKRTRTISAAAGLKSGAAKAGKVKGLRKVLLIAAMVVIIALGAVAGVYVLLPEIRSSDADPVVFLSDGMLYVTRGSEKEDNCFVMDLSDQMAEPGFDRREETALAELEQSIYYDEKEQTLYFLDFSSRLISVRINRLRSGKDISDRVQVLAENVKRESAAQSIMSSGYTVLEKSVLYISQEDSELYSIKDGKKKSVASGVDFYTVSPEGTYVMYLCNNAAVSVHRQYTMYISSLVSARELVKVDSKVSTVEYIKGEFDLLWYTRYDESNKTGPISVWVGGRNIEKEQVLEGVYACEGFSDSGFYYSVLDVQRLVTADFVKDIPETDPEYERYATLREVLGRTTADSELQTVYFWSESGREVLSDKAVSWKVLHSLSGLVEIRECDYAKVEKIDISQLKSAYTVAEYLSNAEALSTLSYSCSNGRAFDAASMKVACVSDEGDKVYIIDSEDASLYSCSPSRVGFGQLIRVSGDVYAAAWWPEESSAVFVRDYNENTLLCDLYVENGENITQLSYNVTIPGGELVLCEDGQTLLYMCKSESSVRNSDADLYIWTGADGELLAPGVKAYAGVSARRVFYIAEDEAGISCLYSSDSGKQALADSVTFVCAPGSQSALELSIITQG